MKKMNVTFKSLLGLGFLFAFMLLGTLTVNAQSEFVNGQPDVVGVTGTKDAALVNTFSFSGVNFLNTNEAKQALINATTQLADDLNADDDEIQNKAYVRSSFYRNIVKGIDLTGEVGTAILGAYPTLEQQASNSPFSDVITAMDILNDTIDMLSN